MTPYAIIFFVKETIYGECRNTMKETLGQDSDSDSLWEFVKEKLNNDAFLEQMHFSPRQIYILHLLVIQERPLFEDMEHQIAEIVKDGTLDVTDIPKIVLLITDIVNVKGININNLYLQKKDLVDFVENILVILLETNWIRTKDNASYEFLLKTSVSLLEAQFQLEAPLETDCTCVWWPFISTKRNKK